MSRVEEIRGRLEQFPSGPHMVEENRNGIIWVRNQDGVIAQVMVPLLGWSRRRESFATARSTAEAYANAPADIAFLLAEVERLTTENTWLKSQLPF
jgi:hypothetical protein